MNPRKIKRSGIVCHPKFIVRFKFKMLITAAVKKQATPSVR
ncbi:MAG TPA: hypothetical protein VFV58_26625 [Blastocatellia bacterium]|nr:hypothetical protein [Blastocatellia bacterium]